MMSNSIPAFSGAPSFSYDPNQHMHQNTQASQASQASQAPQAPRAPQQSIFPQNLNIPQVPFFSNSSADQNQQQEPQSLINFFNTILSISICGWFPTACAYVTLSIAKENQIMLNWIPFKNFWTFPLISFSYMLLGNANTVALGLGYIAYRYMKGTSIPQSIAELVDSAHSGVVSILETIFGLAHVTQLYCDNNLEYSIRLPKDCHFDDLQLQFTTNENNTQGQLLVFRKYPHTGDKYYYYTSIKFDFFVDPDTVQSRFYYNQNNNELIISVPYPQQHIQPVNVAVNDSSISDQHENSHKMMPPSMPVYGTPETI